MRSNFWKLTIPLVFALIAVTACSDGKPVAGGSSDDSGIVAISNMEVAGVSQKGPFVKGSAVTVQELEGETLKQTGKSFKGTIMSDKGDFVINNVNLESQYAILEATGYYRNEVSGGTSGGMLTLRALTDLSKRNTVNINLLTHMEYERVMYLVGTGLSLQDAKNQAETEIFRAFGIQDKFDSPEDLDIFREGDGNAALLAISILMLRDLSEAEFTEFLIDFAADIETDGKWDNEDAKLELAAWANRGSYINRGHIYTQVNLRENIEAWNLGTVPDFEKYLRNFWYMVFGLDECGAEQEGVMSAIKNDSICDRNIEKKSGDFVTTIDICDKNDRYVCKSGVWTLASDFEKDFYGSGKADGGEDGEIWVGPNTGTYYVYDDILKEWTVRGIVSKPYLEQSDTAGVAALMAVGVGCTVKRKDEVRKGKDGLYYVCESSQKWGYSPEFEYDFYSYTGAQCSSDDEGTVFIGGSGVKYYCSSKGWVRMTYGWSWFVPKELRFNPDIVYDSITDERDGKVYKTISIGEQTWIAENLNYADSANTPSLKGNVVCTNSFTIETYSDYGTYTYVPEDTFYTDAAGCFYTWVAAQEICPDGWHLPDNDEWNELFATVGGADIAGKALKSQTGWDGGRNGSDAFGFSAIPVVSSRKNGYTAAYWSATEYSSEEASLVLVEQSSDQVNVSYNSKSNNQYYSINNYKSVRCLKDN